MKISKFIYAAVVGGVLASCQSVDTPMFSDKDAFVAFDSKSTSIAENAAEKYVEYFVVYRWRRDGRLPVDRTYR